MSVRIAPESRSAMLAVRLLASPAAGAGPRPVAFGVPFARSVVKRIPPVAYVESSDGSRRLAQTKPLALWSDGSIKWLLLDAVIAPSVAEEHAWQAVLDMSSSPAEQVLDEDVAETGFALDCGSKRLLLTEGLAQADRAQEITLDASVWHLTDRRGRTHQPVLGMPRIAAAGPVRSSVIQQGDFPRIRGLRIELQWSVYSSIGLARCDVTLHNQRRARHRGGLWDLGDPGSILLKDFSFRLPMNGTPTEQFSVSVGPGKAATVAKQRVLIYQDSSGGENWQSAAHVNRFGKLPCRLSGYQLLADEREETGRRASPQLTVERQGGRITIAVPEFWQQFPKALEATADLLRLGLFPGEFGDLHELQGGEQKRHTFWLQFTPLGEEIASLDWVFNPMHVVPTAEWCVAAGALPDMRPMSGAAQEALQTVLSECLDGDQSILANRELVDEFGWRNFGDMLADHESVYYEGADPFVSHYNNQFDVLLGLLCQFLRTEDVRWFHLADQLARHVIDIDIYHTSKDKAAYSGGLFWFTDHYLTAHESTHRTYARKNAPPKGPYGGGPGAEHNYTSGLLLYHFLTGCPYARNAVIGLAEWVVNMEDGRRTIFGLVDDGPTGTATADQAKPGRGGANSINALVDAWTLTKDARYLELCEQLIRRCIHPHDDIEQLHLLEAEKNWSYTMFLTSLAKYSAAKEEAGQLDATYQLATQSLVHYAQWMLHHERPYFDQASRLEYPTEAWAGQEFRKANVFRRAARYAPTSLTDALNAKGNEFGDRAWRDLMRFEDTRATIRAVALVMTEGLADCVYRHAPESPINRRAGKHDYPDRELFVPQKQRVLAMAKRPMGAVVLGTRLLDPRRWLMRTKMLRSDDVAKS